MVKYNASFKLSRVLDDGTELYLGGFKSYKVTLASIRKLVMVATKKAEKSEE